MTWKKSFGFIIVSLGICIYAAALLIGIPSLQLAHLEAHPKHKPYTAQELRGRQVYIENGCVYCHSQQPRDRNMGPDKQRNWGRAAHPIDFIGDSPHLLGTMRTGPDLHNIGARQPSADWHLVHLYQPRAVLPKSVMPAFPYLFEHKEHPDPNDRLVPVPEKFAPKGMKVVAAPQALDLVKYLKSLDHTYDVSGISKGGAMQKGESSQKTSQALNKERPQASRAKGSQVYSQVCAACHQQNGQGLPGAFPPLAGSSWVLGSPSVPARIILHGLQGEIEVKGSNYNGVMPAFGKQLSDLDIASVILFIRAAWDNTTVDVISAEDVAKIRKTYENRTTAWSSSELKEVSVNE